MLTFRFAPNYTAQSINPGTCKISKYFSIVVSHGTSTHTTLPTEKSSAPLCFLIFPYFFNHPLKMFFPIIGSNVGMQSKSFVYL